MGADPKPLELTVSQKLFSAFIDGAPAGRWSGTRFLGVRLMRFSLWHRMLLRAVDSPFMTNGTLTLRDLRIAAGICRCEFGNSRIRKPWLMPALIYARAILGAFIPFRTKSTPGEPNRLQRALQRNAEAYLEYLGDFLAEPEYAVRRPQSSVQADPKVPCGTFNEEFEHITELVLFFHGALTLAQIWNLPVSAANYWRVVARRASGMEVDPVTDSEEEFMKTLPEEYRHR